MDHMCLKMICCGIFIEKCKGNNFNYLNTTKYKTGCQSVKKDLLSEIAVNKHFKETDIAKYGYMKSASSIYLDI